MAKYIGNYKINEVVKVNGKQGFIGRVIKLTGNFQYRIKDEKTGEVMKDFNYPESYLSPLSIPERIEFCKSIF